MNRTDPTGHDSIADYFCFVGGLLLSGGIIGESPEDLLDLCFPGPPDKPAEDVCKEPDNEAADECDDKYQACINEGPWECQKREGGKTQCRRCQERCKAGDKPSGKCKKCGF